jgi:hypothetical protein
MAMTTFKIGDIVEATTRIRRQDGGAELNPGAQAVVCGVWQEKPGGPAVIDIDCCETHFRFINIVCGDNPPLKPVIPSRRYTCARCGAKARSKS